MEHHRAQRPGQDRATESLQSSRSHLVGRRSARRSLSVRTTSDRAEVGVEVPSRAPATSASSQATFDGTVRFPTFGLSGSGPTPCRRTVGDTAPPQRFAYLGGRGTLPTVDDPLSLGGDQLVQLDSRYEIPFHAYSVPFLGSPTSRHAPPIGSAGVRHLPRFVQNVGSAGRRSSFARVEYIDRPRDARRPISRSGCPFAASRVRQPTIGFAFPWHGAVYLSGVQFAAPHALPTA